MNLTEQQQTLLHIIGRADRHGIMRQSLIDKAFNKGLQGDERDRILTFLEEEELITSRKLRHVGKAGPKPTKYEITRKGVRALAAAEKADV